MSIVSEHLKEYLSLMCKQGLIQTPDNEPIEEENMVFVYIGTLNEGPHGSISNGFTGYLVGKGVDVLALNANAPRTVALAAVELLKPHAGTMPIVDELLEECAKHDAEFLQNQEINESGATNVTKLH